MAQQILQGKNFIAFIRKVSDRGIRPALLIPFRTGWDSDPKYSSSTTETSDGSVVKMGSQTSTVKFDMLKLNSLISDYIQDSFDKAEEVELWGVYTDRAYKGGYYTKYMRGFITDLSSKAAPTDNVVDSVSIAIDKNISIGWVTLNDDTKDELAYTFSGLDIVSTEKNDGTDGNGKPFSLDAEGLYDDKDTAPKQSNASSGSGSASNSGSTGK